MPETPVSTPPDFETAMRRLEEIVGQMESDQLPLAELLERYEEGSGLIKLCQQTLESAEKRIETVTRKLSEPPAPAPEASPAPSSKKPAPDVSLF